MKPVARRIQELRQLRGWSQDELARRIGVTRRVLSTWESGRDVPADDIPRIATELGLTIADFYSDTQPRLLAMLVLAEKLTGALAITPERVEVNFYTGSYERQTETKPTADVDEDVAAFEPATGYMPQRRGRFFKRVVAEWPTMPEEERQEWRELAEAIRREDDKS